ncbi:MAG: hypothetical protein ACKOEO_24670 [Planctomycetaceae bacterium]
MPRDHDDSTESLRSALRRLMPVALLAAVSQCGCASALVNANLLQAAPNAQSAAITKVSLVADEDAVASDTVRPQSRGVVGERAGVVGKTVERRERERPSSGHSLVPRVAAEPVSRTEGAGRAEGGGRPAAETAAEPGMLDRFRALYAPRAEPSIKAEAVDRPDDASERLRRQMLRWSDPFGLLKDRESAGMEGGAAESRLPTEGEPGTAELPATAVPATALKSVIEALEQELRDWPGAAQGRPERVEEWRRRQTDLRLLYSVAGRSADAARVIEGLPREEQEFWQSLMLAMHQYRSPGAGPERTEQLTEALNQVRAAERHLRPLSRLEIYRLQFCTRIDGFGNATSFPTADFEPGQRLLLYAGVRNFRSELTGEGRYRSEFAAVVEFLREEDGEVLERIRLPQIPDECDEERTDYFQSFELTAPVLEGNYRVRLHLRDQLTQQTAEAGLQMTIR